MKKLFILGCLLASPAVLFAQKKDKQKFDFFGGKNEIKEIKRVYLNDFVVQQMVQTSQSATSGNGAARAKMTVNFGGVDGAAYQAMLKEVYDAVKQRLTGLGYEVLSAADAQAKRGDKGCATIGDIEKAHLSVQLSGHVVDLRPAGQTVCYNETPMMGLYYAKMAKELEAMPLRFHFVVHTVSFDKDAHLLGRKASVEGAPQLTLNGSMTLASPKGSGNTSVPEMKHEGMEWVGPNGISLSRSSNMPWMGSSMGRYTLEVKQAEYLAAVKKMLTDAAMNSIDVWQAALQ